MDLLRHLLTERASWTLSAKNRPTGDFIGAMDEEELMQCVGREEHTVPALVGSVGGNESLEASVEAGVTVSGGDRTDVVEMTVNPLMQQQTRVAPPLAQ